MKRLGFFASAVWLLAGCVFSYLVAYLFDDHYKLLKLVDQYQNEAISAKTALDFRTKSLAECNEAKERITEYYSYSIMALDNIIKAVNSCEEHAKCSKRKK